MGVDTPAFGEIEFEYAEHVIAPEQLPVSAKVVVAEPVF
jgi:hypothetical protein